MNDKDIEFKRKRYNLIKQAQKKYNKKKAEHYEALKYQYETKTTVNNECKEVWQ